MQPRLAAFFMFGFGVISMLYNFGRILTMYITIPSMLILLLGIWAEFKRFNDRAEK